MKLRNRRTLLIGVLLLTTIVTCSFVPTIIKRTVLELTKRQLIDKTLHSAYPNSVMQNIEASVGSFPVGNAIGVGVTVTFSTTDSFDLVKNWYSQHPEGGMCSIDGGNFPQCGLEILNDNSGKISYRIFNGLQMGCEQILDCSEVNEPIP